MIAVSAVFCYHVVTLAIVVLFPWKLSSWFSTNVSICCGRVTIAIEVGYKRCNNIVSYEFLWIRRTCDYI